MLHIFLYRIKCILRNRSLIFWTCLFPILLATLYQIAFSNINNNFDVIPVAVVNSSQYKQDVTFQNVLQSVSNKDSKEQLFEVTLTSQQEAEQLLDKNKITGYITYKNNQLALVIKENGINENITKSFLDKYQQTASTLNHILSENSQADYLELMEFTTKNYIQDTSSKTANMIIISYYGLIGMTCLYSSLIGAREISLIQANISDLGARLHASPFHKMKYCFASILATLLVQMCQIALLLFYMIVILRVNFSSNVPFILLACVIGLLSSILIGCLVSVLIKKNEGTKSGILICISMFMCVLSGMMAPQVKYYVSDVFPWIQNLNVANLITDSLYSLYYYDNYTRFFNNLGYLTIISGVLLLLTYLVLRRDNYANL